MKASLEKENIPYVLLGGVKPNPHDSLVYKGIEIVRQNGIDFILAVGGGSTIDSSKAIAMGVPYKGDFWDFYEGKASATCALPIGVVQTIAAAGSEGSGDSVVTKEDGMLKRGASSEHIRPKFAVQNPALLCTLPAYQTACGITDIMAHVFERYFTNTLEVEITDRLCEAVLLTMVKEGPRAIADPANYQVRANIMWAGTVAHNGVVGCGRSQDWNSHAIEHELSAQYNITHGEGMAIVFVAWTKYMAEVKPWRLALLTTRVFGADSYDYSEKERAYILSEKLEQFFKKIGVKTKLSELNIDDKDFDTMAKRATRNGTVGHYVPLDAKAFTDILKLAL